MLQQDTITHATVTHTLPADSAAQEHVLTPADVLAALPDGATPEQQDSAVQANFSPGEVRYCERPDTLPFLRGDSAEQPREAHAAPDDGSLHLSYRVPEGPVRLDSLLAAEPDNGYGMAGDPVPYIVRNDDIITGLMLACFILVVVAVSNSRRFIVRQFRDFLYMPRFGSKPITETSSEVRFQCFLILHTCFLFSIYQYFYTKHYIGDTFVLDSQYQLIAIYFAMFVGYFVAKGLLYTAVNTVFFGSKKNLQYIKSLLFITSTEGVMLFPVVLLQVYFDLQIQNVVICFIVVLIFVKMLTFYKCYFIFFRRPGGFLQIILYFCALEIVPIAAFWGVLMITGNHLKINF